VKEDLRKHYGPNNLGIVLDGEMCIMNGANEDFKAIVSEIKRKNHTIENPKYKIIDTLILEDFFNGQARETFEESLLRMTVNGQYFEVVEQIKVEKIEEVVTLLDHATEMGWEGLIIRDGDLPYKAKRHKGILKIKKFHDAEFTVVATFEGEGKYKGTLGGLTITGSVDGKEINSDVGSGFSDEDRARLWTMGGEIIGQMVTIKYFEISKNKDGEFSLRFPVFKVLHGRKREV
jgi:DNA ligase 1